MLTATASSRETDNLIEMAKTTQGIVHRNLTGVTHDDSLIPPLPAGNCINWVLGHLVCIYDNILPLLGQKAVLAKDASQPYARGSALKSSDEAVPLSELIAAWDEASERFVAGVSGLDSEALDKAAPFSPRKNPHETVRSLLGIISFHQAYHCGQLGLLRRIAGKPGAIA